MIAGNYIYLKLLWMNKKLKNSKKYTQHSQTVKSIIQREDLENSKKMKNDSWSASDLE
jgi:hypothetical protein